ncbi:MAG: methylenetetrahydrofolate--tRNA-(uracil(54)-C(5))-methyltransferase (FADH(2)-oxidizing) TrmFO [Deltaproteobacteria bacterium]|nr:methylenetetrahydrofolate--tRNA-(uracil(54)-C(5))-methyltransferase (FADH(2)-oxidizing) TrmFO [Deltaproteobacteria bacterium]
MIPTVTVMGGGLAGSEAAWQLARRGISVRLVEMKPLKRTPAQQTDHLAELVCSNSLRSTNLNNAVGLLKEEMRRLDSLIIHSALRARVPAGDALAVDRAAFAAAIGHALAELPNITRQARVVESLPPPEEGPVIVATGPLTDAALAADIVAVTGSERLYFYDALAPIVAGDSLNMSSLFAASRYDKGNGSDYLNCPLSEGQYYTFVDALLAAECMPLHAFEEPRYFHACLPAEVVAAQGRDSLRFGAMKPVGLTDPRTGRWPYAVLQLRQEDTHGQAYNLVGFQTKLKHTEQRRVFRSLPGLEGAEFLRLGAIHRNTYLDAPALLDERMCLRARPHVRFAGQITGVEGYVESAAHGLITALLLASELVGTPMAPPPPACALGALCAHVRGDLRLPGRRHEPQNVHWGMVPPTGAAASKQDAKRARVERAVLAFEAWAAGAGLPLLSGAASGDSLRNQRGAA